MGMSVAQLPMEIQHVSLSPVTPFLIFIALVLINVMSFEWRSLLDYKNMILP